jgi:hypothetical protein
LNHAEFLFTLKPVRRQTQEAVLNHTVKLPRWRRLAL